MNIMTSYEGIDQRGFSKKQFGPGMTNDMRE
jgi:hypothetical protein